MREGWKYETLKNLSSVITKGTTPTTLGYSFVDEGVSFVKIESIADNGAIVPEKLAFITIGCHEALKRSQLAAGDILFSIAGALGRVAIVPDAFLPANTNQALAIIRTFDKSPRFLRYLFFYFQSGCVQRLINELKAGVAQLNLSLSQIRELVVPIPSVQEQEKIVAELDCLTGIIEKKKQQLEELDKLAQSIFYDMFGDPITNEKGWEVRRLGTFSNSELGKMLDVKKNKGEAHPYLCSINVQWGHFDLNPVKQMGFEDDELERYSVKKGDLLICEGGDTGRCAIWKEDYTIFYQNALHRVRFDEKVMLPAVCQFVMKTYKDNGEMDKYSKGQTIKHLVKKTLLSIPMITPPIDLQNEFAQKIEAIEKQKELVKRSIVETETLFNSRMDYWFNN